MQQDQQPIQKLYTNFTRIQQKLDNHIKKIDTLLADDIEEEDSFSATELSHYNKQLRKQLQKFKRDIDDGIFQLELSTNNSNNIVLKYNILRQNRREMVESINTIRQQLKLMKTKIAKCKKLQMSLKFLQNQYNLQSTSVNKTQLSYTNALKLQKQMGQKLQQMEKREISLNYQHERQREKDNQAMTYWSAWEKYEKLMNHKNLVIKHYQDVIEQSNKIYNKRSEQIQKIKQKIHAYDEVYQQLEVNTNEQQLIIRQIMMKEGLTGLQILETAKADYEDQPSSQQERNEEYAENYIKNFRKKIGIRDYFNQSRMSKNLKPNRVHTQHIMTYLNQKKNRSDKNFQLSLELPNNMRMTTKKSLGKHALVDDEGNSYIGKKKKSLPLNNKHNTELPKLSSNHLLQKNNYQIVSPYKQQIIPLTQQLKAFASSVTTPKHMNKRKKFSSQSGINAFENSYKNCSNRKYPLSNAGSQNQFEKQSIFQDLQLNFRVRTKNGYVYKNRKKIDDNFSNQSHSSHSSIFKQKSEIIELYDKLAKHQLNLPKSGLNKNVEQDCTCQNKDGSVNSNEYDKANQEVQQKQKKQLTYVKLSLKSRGKKGRQNNKLAIQSRQSDGQIQQKNSNRGLKMKNSKVSINNDGSQKMKDEQSKNRSQLQQKCNEIRKRLKTIHQKQQQK